MKLNKDYKKIIIIINIILFIILISNNVKATHEGFTENMPGPRKYFSTSKTTLSDVTLTLVSSNAMKQVKIYEDSKEIKPTESITTNAKNHIYKFSHNDILKGKKHTYTVKVVDEGDNQHQSSFSIIVKSKTVDGKETKYYSINDAPRITEWLASEKTVYFKNKDLDGIKSLKIEDMNSDESTSVSDLNGLNNYVKIDTKNFKAVNNYFKLKITATENNDSKKSVQIVNFKLSNKKIKLNINDKNVSKMLELIESYSQQIQKDYKNGNYWEYSNRKIEYGEKPTHNSFADAKNGNRTTNCARIVFWSFYDMKIITKKEDIFSNSSGYLKASDQAKKEIQNYADIIKVNKTPNQLKSEKNLKKGDICLYAGHTNIYIGNGKWYDAGRGSGVGNASVYRYGNNGTYPIYRFKTVGPCESTYVNTKAVHIIRLKDQS